MDFQIDKEFLYKNGFTAAEIEHLSQLRDTYRSEEESPQHKQQHRLEFVRWMALSGKLTEDIA